MDVRRMADEIFSGLDAEVAAFTKKLIEDRVNSGDIDPSTMSFSEMETLSHEIGQRVARMLGKQMTAQQSEMLQSEDYNCPTCGLECEAIQHRRTIQTVDGDTEIVELKSYCPKCRRNFFPGAEHQWP